MTCPRCGRTSHNPHDLAQNYCGHCHLFLDDYPVVRVNGGTGDVRFECPVCHWSVTLRPMGAAQWTKGGTITPRCTKDDVELVRTVR